MPNSVRPHRRQPLGFSRQEHWSGLPFPSPMHACMLSRFSCVRLRATPWRAAHQTPLSTGFSRQEYWSGLPFPSSPVILAMPILLWTLNIQQKFNGSPVSLKHFLCVSLSSPVLCPVYSLYGFSPPGFRHLYSQFTETAMLCLGSLVKLQKLPSGRKLVKLSRS